MFLIIDSTAPEQPRSNHIDGIPRAEMLRDRRNLSSLDFQAHPSSAHAHRAPDAEGAVYAPTQVARPQTSRSPIQNETGGCQNERRFLDGRAIAGRRHAALLALRRRPRRREADTAVFVRLCGPLGRPTY